MPNFTRISHKIIEQLKLNYHAIIQIRTRNLEKALNVQNNNFSDLSDKLENLRSQLTNFIPSCEIDQISSIFKNQIIKIETFNDTRRAKKMEKLKNEKLKKNKF